MLEQPLGSNLEPHVTNMQLLANACFDTEPALVMLYETVKKDRITMNQCEYILSKLQTATCAMRELHNRMRAICPTQDAA